MSSSKWLIFIFLRLTASLRCSNPFPPTGVFASSPPIILGAMKATTLSASFLSIMEKLRVEPPSTSTLSIPSLPSQSNKYDKSTFESNSGVITTWTLLNPFNSSIFCLSALSVVAMIVFLSESILSTFESGGILKLESTIILVASVPPFLSLVVRDGSSFIMVFTPTIIPETRFLNSCT
ncbi:hypothetical protein SDC9_78331 [bioreactor metagenome]|uniref:Uncharacterized protein n=1 Tax=bioreactor metagenome TaxID=1076179 RepID=A0A644Z0Q5_9ZZZZ